MHLFPAACIDHIVIETNRYAKEVLSIEQYATWSDAYNAEIKAFFGFNILMGLVWMPALEDYWKIGNHFHYAPIASRISRDRFKQLSRCLHFTTNADLKQRGERGYDRLGKVREVINILKNAQLEAYNMTKSIVVDEAMIPFKGRSCLKQYLKNKPVKRGIKVWCLADSSNGFIQNFDVYTGKGSGNESEGTTLGARVVLLLSQHLHGKYHHIYCDNYFTSAALFQTLQERGTYACGMVRQTSKEFPQQLRVPKSKKVQKQKGLCQRYETNMYHVGVSNIAICLTHYRGDFITMQNNEMSAVTWLDNKVVTMLSTNCQPNETTTTKRKLKDGSRIVIPCPAALSLYSENMRGVDHNDQLRGYYMVRSKSRKFYKHIFMFLLELAITNSFVLHSTYANVSKLITLRTYRLKLAEQLINTYNSRKRLGRRPFQTQHQTPQHYAMKHKSTSKKGVSRCECVAKMDGGGKPPGTAAIAT